MVNKNILNKFNQLGIQFFGFLISLSFVVGCGTKDNFAVTPTSTSTSDSTTTTPVDNTSNLPAPYATLSTQAPNYFSTSTIEIEVLFSRSVVGLTTTSLNVTNGNVTALSGSGTNYAVTITPTSNGVVSVIIPANSVVDPITGKGNYASNVISKTYDANSLSAVLASTVASNSNTTTIPVSVIFNKSVTTFNQSKVYVINGTISNFSGFGTNYSFTITPASQGIVRVVVLPGSVKDPAGNDLTSSNELSFTFDTQASNPPSLITLINPATSPNSVNTPTLKVQGVNPGETITLYTNSNCSGSPVASGTATGSSIDLTSSALTTGVYTFYAKTTDNSGNSSVCSSPSVTNYVLDSAPPPPPSSILLSGAQTTPSPVTNPTFIVSGLEASTLVELYNNSTCNSSLLGSATEVGGGMASVTLSNLALDANYTIYAKAKDSVGNYSMCSTVYATYTLDRAAPSVPSPITLVLPSSSSGILNTPHIKVSNVTSGDVIKLYTDSTCTTPKLVATGTATTSNIELTSSILTTGNYNFYAKAIDPAGNASACSTDNAPYTLQLAVAPTPPSSLALLTPSTSPNHFTTPTIRLSGVAEGNTVNLYTNSICAANAQVGTANVSAGNTSVDITTSELTAGATSTSYQFYAKTIDNNSGSSSNCSTATVSYVVDTSAPPLFTSITLGTNPPTSPSNVTTPAIVVNGLISGTSVELYSSAACDTTTLGTANESFGSANVVISPLTIDNTYNIYGKVKDAAGNYSACSTLFVTYKLDRVAPAAADGLILSNPTSSPGNIMAPQITVSGVTSGDTVVLFESSSCTPPSVATGTATSSSILLKTNNLTTVAHSFYAKVTDPASNASPCSTVKVDYELLGATAPVAPTALTLVTPSSSPSSVTTPTVHVAGVRAGETITLYSDNSCNTQIAIGAVAAGTTTIDLSVTNPMASGTYLMAAKATDSTTNSSPCSSATLNYVLDATPPTAPTGLSLVFPSSSPGKLTTPTIKVTGVTSGDTIGLYTNSNCSTLLTSAVSSGTVINFPLSTPLTTDTTPLTYRFYAKATDPLGNISNCSSEYVEYILDTTAPNPPTAITVISPSSTTSNVTSPKLKVTGLEANSFVDIYSNSTCSSSVVKSASEYTGMASISIDALNIDGTYTFYAKVRDAADNTSTCDSTIFATYNLTRATPSAPTTLSLFAPSTSPNSVAAPQISVGGVSSGDAVYLYSDATCTNLVGSELVAGAATSVNITSTDLTVGTYEFHAKRITAAGNSSNCSTTGKVAYVFVNVSAPVTPNSVTVISPLSSPNLVNTPTVRVGGVVSGDFVTLYKDSNCSAQIASGTATGTTIDLSTSALSPDGDYQFYAKSTNVFGNASGCSTSTNGTSYKLDTTAPLVPSTISLITPVTNTGKLTTPVIQVGGVVAGDTVNLYKDNVCLLKVASGLVPTNATTINLTTSTLTEGSYLFYAKSQDPAGNISGCSTATLTNPYVLDTTAPNSPSGIVLSDPVSNTSNSTTPTFIISGLDAGATAELFSNSNCSSTILGSSVENSGVASITINPLSVDASYTIYARAKDSVGNNSICSSSFVTYNLDRVAPSVPTNVTMNTPLTSSGSLLTPKIAVSGLTSGDIVKLYKSSSCDEVNLVGSATVTSSTQILTSIPLTTVATYEFYAKAFDAAGNSLGCSTAKATYSLTSATIPIAPNNISLINPATSPGTISSPTIRVTGVAAGDTVVLYKDNACTQQVSVGIVQNGESSIDLISAGLSSGTYNFFAKKIDPASNSSACSVATLEYIVQSSAVPSTPSSLTLLSPANPLSNVTTPSFLVGGLESGVTVELFANGTCTTSVLGSATENAGSSIVTLSPGLSIDQLYTIYARAKNANNITSLCSVVFVNYTLDRSTPNSPSSLALANPTSTNGNVTKPQITVGGLSSGQVVRLFKSNTCAANSIVATETAAGSSQSITLANDLTDGTYDFYATTTSLAGNTSNCSTATVKYILYTGVPATPTSIQLTTSPSSSPSNNPTPTVRVNGVTPGNTVYIYKDPICTDAYVVTTQLASAAAVEIILPTLTENNYTFYARAKDTSGNYSNCTAVGLDYSLDLTPPNLPTGMSRITPAAALGNVNTPTIQVAGVSNGTVVKIYLDDNTCSNTAFATQTATSTSVNITLTTISDGSHNFYAKTFDAVGNSSACSAASSISLNYTVDTTPPTAPSSFVDGSTVTSITYTPDATWNASSDANGIARYELAVGSSPSGTDIKTWTSVSIPNPLSASLSGFTVTNGVTYYTRIRAVDNAGNYSTIVNGDGWVGSIPVVGSVVESCALKTDGAVYCWGPNNYGQVGDGSTVDRLTPYGIPTLSSGVTSITSSPDGTSYCAIKSGAVYCWGRNDNGQLGNNTTTNQKTPVQPLDGGTLQPTILASGVTQIAMSNYHTCALKNTILYCWGTNSWGQLGTGNTNNYYTPALIISSGVSSVSLSYGWNGTSTYAIMSTGELRTWGYNGYYQLGNSNTTSSNTPIPNIFTSGVTAAVSNDYQTCVIRNGALLCWGYQANTTYYLANNFYNYSNVSPTPSTGISSGVTAVALGNQFGCAIVNAQLQCWGNNGYGQVGNGNTSNPSSIYVNPNLTSISALYIKDNRTCVVKSSGALYCFGANGSGESGSNTGFDNYVTSNPVAAVSSGTGTSTKSVAMSVNGSTCAVVSSGLRCWGRMDRGQVPIGVIGNKTTPSTITLGGGTTGVTKVTKGTGNLYSSMPTRCAIRSGNLFCWGANHAGQIGDGTTTYKSTPYQVLTGGVTDVKVSTSGTVCAIQSGAVKCWGYNGYGNVGDSGSTNRTTPYAVPSMNLGVTALDIAPDHTCGVSNSIAVCWGYNGYGQVTGTNVNNGNNLPPTTISSVQYVTNVYTMNNRTCLMSTTAGSSTLYCWGYNPYGALGTYNTTNYYTPQVIWGSGGFTFYAYSQEEAAHSCGIKSGSLACWGYNGYGQLGIGNTSQYTYPVGVSATNPTFIAIGTQWSSNSTCGIFNGAMKCWGYNGQGQLATGDTTQQTTPFATVLNGAVDAVNKISLSNVGGCAVVGDTGSGGYLRCWGQNNYGQVGNGTLNNLYTPNANIINSGVTHVETSHNGEITCAIVNTTLQCWGRNDQGQIGDGTGPVMTPATISL